MIEMLDRLYHWLALKLRCDFYVPGINWVCDRHEHNVTGISMAELRQERRERRAAKRRLRAFDSANRRGEPPA